TVATEGPGVWNIVRCHSFQLRQELNVCRTHRTWHRTPAGCYVPVLVTFRKRHCTPTVCDLASSTCYKHCTPTVCDALLTARRARCTEPDASPSCPPSWRRAATAACCALYTLPSWRRAATAWCECFVEHYPPAVDPWYWLFDLVFWSALWFAATKVVRPGSNQHKAEFKNRG